MEGKKGPHPEYHPHPHPHQPPIAQARGTANAVYQVCVRVEQILPKRLRVQEISIIDAYSNPPDVRTLAL